MITERTINFHDTYEDFVAEVKARGCRVLLKENNTYDNDWALPVLYAEVNNTLIGTWSDRHRGRTFSKCNQWSKKWRGFQKIPI